jgi:D-3-phosphoglycerate dehydrogenase
MASEYRVLVTDYTWENTDIEAGVLRGVGADLVEAKTGKEDELISLVETADAILTCFALVTPRVVRAGKRLQVIGRYGIGTDNIAVATATELGIPVTNVPVYCADEVAEHVIAMIFCLVRGLHQYNRAVRNGDWSLGSGLPTRRIAGSTLGIIGHGPIAQALERRAHGLGMKVLIHTRTGRVPLLELAARSDYVSLHVPLTEATRAMVDERFLRTMKPTSYLINAARGAIIDQDALLAALSQGRLEGAGLDVFVPERLPADHPLLQEQRVLATPHTAFYSEESVRDLAGLAAENVAAILAGRLPAAIVNPQVLALPRWRQLSS